MKPPWPTCRTHGEPLHPSGVCPACAAEDWAEVRQLFDELVTPLRAEGGPFARTPRLGEFK